MPDTTAPPHEAVRQTYLAAASIAVDLVASPDVGAAWDRPSILPGYRVGGLAAHLGRALVTVDTYLAAPPPEPAAPRVDAVRYFVAALAEHDPVASAFHGAVRERSEQAAAAGPRSVADGLRAVHDRLAARALDLAQPLSVFDGMAITLGDYLRTRLVELTVHGADLADSVDRPRPSFAPDAWAVAARVVAEVALARHPPDRVTMALARADRSPAVPAF